MNLRRNGYLGVNQGQLIVFFVAANIANLDTFQYCVFFRCLFINYRVVLNARAISHPTITLKEDNFGIEVSGIFGLLVLVADIWLDQNQLNNAFLKK